MYIRFEAAEASASGRRPGVFALANWLAGEDRLTPAEWQWWRENNDWMDVAYPDPATVDPSLFDRTIHPMTSCWFKVSAAHLIDRVAGYLDLLDAHGVAWIERRSDDPGTVLYEDDVQVVVEPRSAR